MFGVQLTEHFGTVMMMNDGVDDEIEDSGNHFHSKMVLAFRYVDDERR